MKVVLLGALAMVGAGAVTMPLRGDLNARYERAPTVVDEATIPKPAVARALSLGHTEWAADLLWVNAQIYYGEGLLQRLPGRFSRAYASAIVGLDPQFRQGYLWAAMALTLRTTDVPTADIEEAVAYLREAHRRIPADPEIEGQLGYNLTYELSPRYGRGSARYQATRGEGGHHLAQAAALGWGPEWMVLTASRVLQQGGRNEEALSVLRDSLARVSDPALLPRIEARIQELSSQAPGDDPVVRASAEVDRLRREEYPYLPPLLYLFVGPRGEVTPADARASAP